MSVRQGYSRLRREATPDTSDDAIAEIERRVLRLRDAGDPRHNVATLEYLIWVARERPAERQEAVRLALHGLSDGA